MAVNQDTSMTIRMNREIKNQAKKIFADLGMDMTTAINVFLRQVIYHNGFPFEVKYETPNEETRMAIEAAEKGKGLHGPFNNISDLMVDLEKDTGEE